MKASRLRYFILILGTLLFIDWVLGAAQASGAIPTWTFLIPNFPFGALFLWMEHSWTGTHYMVMGYRIGDIGSLVVFLAVVLAQSFLYYLIYLWWYDKQNLKYSSTH
jgi:hypothetical protein